MTTLLRLAVVAALACTLVGCTDMVDGDQARTCRTAIPALNLSASDIEILRTTPLATRDGVRVDYRARAEGGPASDRFLECRFAPGAIPSERNVIVEANTESGPLSDVRLQLIRRFWLRGTELAGDPAPVWNAAHVPTMPRVIAVGLQHLVSALPLTAIYAMLAAAYSLIYGLVGRINLAFGELAAVGGYATFLTFVLADGSRGSVAVPLALALTVALTTALSYGIATGRLVFAPLMLRTGQQLLIGTISLAIVLQEFMRLAQGSRHLWLRPMLNTPSAVARSDDFVVTVTPSAITGAAICLIAALALLAVMKRTRFGRAWRACADDPLAAELFGIDRGAVLFKTFALASLLTGLAGYVATVYYGTFGYVGGVSLGLKSLIAAIIGGIGSVPGAFLGGLLLGFAETSWSALFPIEFRDLAIFVLLVFLLIVRPGGLFGLHEVLPPKV
jgi:branched-chain amino acid transport system permease protein